MRKLIVVAVAVFTSSFAHAGVWLNGKEILRPEARTGNIVSVILKDTLVDGTNGAVCNKNRVFFQKGKYIDMEGVNHHFSLILSAFATKKLMSIHVEKEGDSCYGRISYIEP